MAAVRHLGFVDGHRGTTHEDPFMATIPCKNFVMISLILLKVLVLPLRLKVLLMAQNFSFVNLDPKIHGNILYPQEHLVARNDAF